MEDLGDILFYVIIAIIGIIGAIVNKKKQKAEKTVNIPSSSDSYEETYNYGERDKVIAEGRRSEGANTRYETIDEEILQSVEAPSSYNISSDKTDDQDLIMGAEYEGDYTEPLADDFAREGIFATDLSISQSELGTDSEILLKEEGSWAGDLIEDFDLPKAIVYSEILNRKDFV